MRKIKIGIVNGLLNYEYNYLIERFLEELNVSYTCSSKTNKKTLEDGKKFLVDESCLSMKIYFGHIYELLDKCDYILIMRCPSMRKKEMMCTNFYASFDLANNIFPNKIIELNIDINNHISLKKAFLNLGKRLCFSKHDVKRAFEIAYHDHLKRKEKLYDEQQLLLKSDKKKILLVGHSYNLLDDYIIKDIKDILHENNFEILLSTNFKEDNSKKYRYISKDVYWSSSIDILNAIMEYSKDVDGIILVSSFPCGPDSLVNEMIMRKIDKPILNLVIDEANDNGGVVTRVESFIDIINMKEEFCD